MKNQIIALSLSVLAFSACDKTEAVAQSATQTAASAKPTATVPGTEKIALATAEGTKFDPPIGEDEVPDQAWMCSMGGKVHFTRTEEGDGKCPVCGMKLQHHMDGEQKMIMNHE